MQVPAGQQTILFIGVSTGSSASRRMFPLWAQALGLNQARLEGVDLPLEAPAQVYRQVVGRLMASDDLRGALVTSHKLNLLQAAGDLFDELTPEAQRSGEVSCIYKQQGRLVGHAVDAAASAAGLERLLGAGYWATRPADLLCLGAGGAAAAILAGMLEDRPTADRPRRMLFVDRKEARLEALQALARRLALGEIVLGWACHQAPEQNDRLMAELPPGSLVINATGMGKDLPGSPVTQAGMFPLDGAAWELNYRGELVFLHQARAQAVQRHLRVDDGWHTFVTGWALVLARVFERPIAAAEMALLSALAEGVRQG